LSNYCQVSNFKFVTILFLQVKMVHQKPNIITVSSQVMICCFRLIIHDQEVMGSNPHHEDYISEPTHLLQTLIFSETYFLTIWLFLFPPNFYMPISNNNFFLIINILRHFKFSTKQLNLKIITMKTLLEHVLLASFFLVK
jgi:hypothetical protein